MIKNLGLLGLVGLLALPGGAKAQNAMATANAPAYKAGANPLSMDLSGNLRVSGGGGGGGTVTQGPAGAAPWLVAEQTLDAAIATGQTTAPANELAVGGVFTSAGVTLTNGQIAPLQVTSAGALTTADVSLGKSVSTQGATPPQIVLLSVGGIYNATPPTLTTGTATKEQYDVNGRLEIAPSASTSATGATPTPIVAAASTNATLVSTGSHNVYGLQCFTNNATVARYIKLYNKATAPVPGTDTPLGVYLIPASTLSVSVDYGVPSVGLNFPLGLGYAITTNPALADATALSAADTFCTLEYK